MIEQHLSIQDTIAIACLIGTAIKLVQFFYFDKLNQGGKTNGLNDNKHG